MDHKTVTDIYNAELDKAVRKFNVPNIADTALIIQPMGRCIGRAGFDSGKFFVKLDTHHVNAHSEADIRDTIIHEIAHVVCFVRPELGKGHNPGWRRVCTSLGGTGDRTHDLDIKPLKEKTIKRYVYDVDGKEFVVVNKVHEMIQARPLFGQRIIPNDGTPSVVIFPRHLVRVDSYRNVNGKRELIQPTLTTTDFSGMSKVEACKLILQQNPNITRGAGIELFMQYLGMSKAGASTYYQNLKKSGQS